MIDVNVVSRAVEISSSFGMNPRTEIRPLRY